jgi:tetratricopeptide (TPR) repeat protein
LLPRLEEIRKAQPKNIMLAYFLGQQYFDAGKLDKAQELLEEVQSQKPTVQSYRRLAELYRRTGQTEKLLELLGQMIEKGGSLAPLGSDGKEMAADDKLVTSLVETAQKKYGGAADSDHDALKAAALIAGQAKRWDDAEKLFNLAIKARPNAASESLLSWGLGLFLDEKYDRAAAVFQRGIDDKNLAGDNASLYFYLAGALEMQGKTDEALVAAKTAAEKDAKNANMASRPAWILYHAKRYDDAAKAYEAIVEKFDDDFATDGARELVREARSALSNLCVIRHDIPPAVEWLEQVLDEFPDDPGANNDLGYLWADENQHLHRALRMIQLAVTAEPDNYAYRDSLGWVLHRLGRDSEALVQLQKAVEPEKPEGEVLDHLGEVYAKLGQTGEAQSAWKRSAEAYKKAGEEAKMKAVEKKMTKAK